MKGITPFLWFDNNAAEAVDYYSKIFKNLKTINTSRGPDGKVFTVSFKLENLDLTALNGGPVFKFTQAISFFVACKTRKELDAIWDKLSVEGKVLMKLDKYPFSERYGWVQDKYGLTWQLILNNNSQKITPILLFADTQRGNAGSAIKLYTSIFKDSKIDTMIKYTQNDMDKGNVMHSSFKLRGQGFMAMDSHNDAKINFNEAVSFVVHCENEKEVDYYWEKLSKGGKTSQCGWLKDKYGVSWQIFPTILGKMLADKKKSKKVMDAVMKMTKLDIKTLQKAYK